MTELDKGKKMKHEKYDRFEKLFYRWESKLINQAPIGSARKQSSTGISSILYIPHVWLLYNVDINDQIWLL